MQTTKSVILGALGMFPIEFGESDVVAIESKVLASYSTGHPNSNLLGLAYVSARNWAIEELRKRATAAKRKAASLLEEERKKEERARFERCKKEFDDLVFKLLPRLVYSQDKQLDIVRQTFFEGLTDDECASVFPGTSANQRYQWKHRGIQLLLAQVGVSDELQKFLRARMRRRTS